MDLNTRYLKQFRALLPVGWLWGDDPALDTLLSHLAKPFARIHQRALDLIEEADPRTCRESLSDWEEMLALPDKCLLKAGNPTFSERRDAVVAKLIAPAGINAAYYYNVAAALDYSITIERFRPFICNLARCGDSLTAEDSRFIWRVRVHGPRVRRFHVGASMTGETLGKIVRAADLECRLRTLAPSHTDLIMSYEA